MPNAPGVKQELLRDAPVVDNLLLQSLSRLREEALSSGFQSVAIRDVDFMISNNGSWSQEFLKKQGYPIGRKAWATVQKRAREGGQLGRREVEAQLRGGGRKKVDHSLLEVTRQVLLQHAKPGSTVAHVHRNEDGTLGQARRRGEKSQEAVVPSQSLLSKPARIWQEHPEIRQRISRSGFYKLMKQSFADFRPGQRATDICSHCQCYWDHIVPRFHRDWNKAKADLTSVYPRYFAHMPENQVFADAGEEAAAALRYVRSHCQRHQQERAASGCDLLQLRTFTEGPAETLLSGHVSLLQSYLWRMLSARRQQECLKQLMGGGLAIRDTLLIFDWKEKIRLPIGPQETSAMWHCQQKYAISCFGCCVLSHKPTSTVAKPDIQTTYPLLLNEVREQNAEASNRMLQEVIRECSVSTEGVLHLWADCGPHFRSAENLHHHMYDLCVKRKQVINCSFLAEQHGKNVLDSAFGALSRWLGKQAFCIVCAKPA